MLKTGPLLLKHLLVLFELRTQLIKKDDLDELLFFSLPPFQQLLIQLALAQYPKIFQFV